jgi:hypothetical protein
VERYGYRRVAGSREPDVTALLADRAISKFGEHRDTGCTGDNRQRTHASGSDGNVDDFVFRGENPTFLRSSFDAKLDGFLNVRERFFTGAPLADAPGYYRALSDNPSVLTRAKHYWKPHAWRIRERGHTGQHKRAAEADSPLNMPTLC